MPRSRPPIAAGCLRPPAGLLLLLVLVAACAQRELPEVSAAAATARAEAESRQVLTGYLAETRDFGPRNSTLAYQVVERGDVLVPALEDMLAEARDDLDRYHLIRLGCIGIRSGSIHTGPDAGLLQALDRARTEIRLHTDLRRYADSELRHCDAPEGTASVTGGRT
jgi:hypothetical protein